MRNSLADLSSKSCFINIKLQKILALPNITSSKLFPHFVSLLRLSKKVSHHPRRLATQPFGCKKKTRDVTTSSVVAWPCAIIVMTCESAEHEPGTYPPRHRKKPISIGNTPSKWWIFHCHINFRGVVTGWCEPRSLCYSAAGKFWDRESEKKIIFL